MIRIEQLEDNRRWARTSSDAVKLAMVKFGEMHSGKSGRSDNFIEPATFELGVHICNRCGSFPSGHTVEAGMVEFGKMRQFN